MGKNRMGRRWIGFRFLAASMALGVFAGCASGGFTLTRSMAKWLNARNIVLRVLLYIFLWPVFVITVIIDEVIFNTIDFWTGKVSAKVDVYERDGVRVMVAHSRDPLRRSVITIDGKGVHSVLELRETAAGSIEVYRDGVKKAEVKDIESALPAMISYRDDGRTQAWSRTLDLEALRDIETLTPQEGYARTAMQLRIPDMQLVCGK